jgi:hypothetical protein
MIIATIAIAAYILGDFNGWMAHGRAIREDQERLRWLRMSTDQKLVELTRQVEAMKLKQGRL